MSDEAYDFDEQLDFGLQWEEALAERLDEILMRMSIQNISYDDQPQIQRSGIDMIASKEDPAFDTKTQAYEKVHSGNLPFETWSVYEDMKPGWFYTSEADVIAWVYANQAGTGLLPTGYLMFLTEALRKWFNENIEDFREAEIPNRGRYGEYTTICRLVPVERVPDDYLHEFQPQLPLDQDTPQADLSGGWE